MHEKEKSSFKLPRNVKALYISHCHQIENDFSSSFYYFYIFETRQLQ